MTRAETLEEALGRACETYLEAKQAETTARYLWFLARQTRSDQSEEAYEVLCRACALRERALEAYRDLARR